jgi:hypothetical protein
MRTRISTIDFADQPRMLPATLVSVDPDPGFGRVGQLMNMHVVAAGDVFIYPVGSGVLPASLSLNSSPETIAHADPFL